MTTICALLEEQTAITAIPDSEPNALLNGHDSNTWTFGTRSQHDIVIAFLFEGTVYANSTSTSTASMVSICLSINLDIMANISSSIASTKPGFGNVVVDRPQLQFPETLR